MLRAFLSLFFALGVTFSVVRADEAEVETIVLIRHGEKPEADLGQLTCQGLNRALALPEVLIPRFGKPAFIFAPLTSQKGKDGKMYSYIRPLVTIAPTAIRLGMPVNADIPFDKIDALEEELLKPDYHKALIFIAWEHHLAEALTRNMMKHLGGQTEVPPWNGQDYDSIYILTIRTEKGTRTIEFRHDQEGLVPSADCAGS